MQNKAWILMVNLGCLWNSSSLSLTTFSSHCWLKYWSLSFIKHWIASILIVWTLSSRNNFSNGSTSSPKHFLDTVLTSNGMKSIVANLTRQVLSLDSFLTSGMISSSVLSSPMDLANFEIFYIKETRTSVADSFMMATTGGTM